MNKIFFLFIVIYYINCFITEGVDVSAWDENVDFKKVKSSGKTFVILRAGTGAGNKDTVFDSYYKKAKEVGLDIGAYWYSYAKVSADGTKEANYILNVIEGKKFEYPIFYDVEEKSIFESGITNNIIENFCSLLESKGYYCGIYASKFYLEQYFSPDVKSKYDVWVAQYDTKCTYRENFYIWQSTGSGSCPGMTGEVDLNTCYIDYPTLIKSKHFNGY